MMRARSTCSRTRTAVCLIFSGLSGILALTACAPSVTIDARNDASGPATVLIEQDVAFEDDRVLARATLRPGETAQLGSFEVGLDTVTARIIDTGDSGTPTRRTRLSRGFSRVIIEEGGSESWSPWVIRIER